MAKLSPRTDIAFVAMLAAVGLGCWWMAEQGAPPTFIAINGAAALTAFGLSLLRVPRRASAVPVVLAPALAAVAILWGPSIDEVHRWIAVGGLRLHAVMLAGPAFTVALARRRDPLCTTAVILLALLLTWQPDFGTLLALCAALIVIVVMTRDVVLTLTLMISLALLAFSWARPDPLPPVEHVEGVLQALWIARHPLAAAALAALALAFVLPLRRGLPGAAFAAWHAGLAGASLIGPYPTPLIGYGASAILGFGLGWILLRNP